MPLMSFEPGGTASPTAEATIEPFGPTVVAPFVPAATSFGSMTDVTRPAPS